MNDYLLNILHLLLTRNNYNISKKELSLQLLTHPDYLTAKSISETLEQFKVKYLTVSIPKESLMELPQTFMAELVQQNESKFVTVERKNGTLLLHTNHDEFIEVITDEFIELWTGVVVLVEENTTKNRKLKQFSIAYVGVGSFFLALAIFISKVHSEIFLALYFAASIIGLIISVFILREELGFNLDFIKKFCQINARTNCNDVFNSFSANLFGKIKLSDLSIIYFTSVVSCTIVFSLLKANPTLILFLLSLSSLPFVFYSIYAQMKLVKKWCPLCLGISFVLVSQFIILFIAFDFGQFKLSTILVLNQILIFFSIVLALIFTWYYLKQEIRNLASIQKLKLENLKFNRNYHLFLSYYRNMESRGTNIPGVTEIILGNKDTIIEILVITNPLCDSCIKAHFELLNLLRNYELDIHLRIRFFVPWANRTDPRTQVAERLLELYQKEEKGVFLNAYQEWYANPSMSWLNRYGQVKNMLYNESLQFHRGWCENQGIVITPSIFLNGKSFPSFYNLSSLKYFIEKIILTAKEEK